MATLDIKYQLQQGSGRTGEPVRVNNWEIDIPALGPVALYANEFVSPALDIETMEVRHMNAVTKLAGKIKVEGGSIKIRDVLDPDMHGGMMAWVKRVYDQETGTLGFASEYKEMGFARRYDSKGGLVRTMELQGIWIRKANHGDWNYDSAEGAMLDVELEVDSFIII
jgi:hypothetical protein